jgi:class 3 adenylate cyclase
LTTQTLPAEGPWHLKPSARALLLIDVPGSLRVCKQLGDARAYHVLKFLAETIRQAPTAKGRVVRALGDGYMLAFDSVDEALAHAVTAQQEVARCNPTEVPLKVRCGIHYGEVIEADNDCFGVSVYLASRVTNHAHGGEILLTEAARSALREERDGFTDFGPTLLPGFEDPVRLFEFAWNANG